MKHQTDFPRPLNSVDVLGVPVVDATTRQTIDWILAGGARTVSFLNAHCANLRSKDPHYAAALRRTDLILPDGVGVEMAARMTGQCLTENLNGTDFTPELLRVAAAQGRSIFLFGGVPGTAEAAARQLLLKVPDLRIVGTRDGFAGAANPKEAINQINASGADIVLVAMGVPLQEMWIDRHERDLNASLILGVGAFFDFMAGNVSRAPKMVRKSKLEWVWRLAIEPRRMAKRYLLGNFAFMARAARYAVSRTSIDTVLKRGFDIAASLSLLLLISPILLTVAALIKLESPGPALFRQVRVGKNGAHFTILKFRSMHTDAEARLAKIRETSDREGVCFKSRHDPRITRVGRFIRRFSIDELPQVLNVLFGDMSLVGPRPGLPSEVEAYPTRAMERLQARPGITGLWQVSGRADIGFDKMVDMDVAYVRSRSFLLDLLLLALTARAVLSGRGAY
ncbi:WecB/TagA/CpsF family glycosyltransferase [Actibacterium pelagium]|uniref:Bacterial sugar transferase domain-containing protein n=1 Tax=Actibacterium pelagium TaxID=2029103 RepID=A0A917EMV6_9RHOB|nr:WecB/TagA/CpsF family glycosyltransferase [Actibacterium pelagium]GGE62474.1 hypothetical protein GCM10011517_32740 [Actibacterium pelagium]